MGKKESKSIMEKEIEVLAKKYKLSAIIYAPGTCSMSFFYNESGRLMVLDHAQCELKSHEVMRDAKAIHWARCKAETEMGNIMIKSISPQDKHEEIKYIG